MALHLLFVYGTLQRGESNHRLLARSRFVGTARTPPAYTLLDLGGFPAVVEGGATAVEGEIWEVDDATLRLVDRLEDHPRFYRRVTVVLDDGVTCQTYLLPRDMAGLAPPIASGRWCPRRGDPSSGAEGPSS